MLSLDRPIVLIACGSFNPPTRKHMLVMEMARTALQKRGYTVIEGNLSPASDAYGKPDLAPAVHRMMMISHAVSTSDWILPDFWAVTQPCWNRTLTVLKMKKAFAEKKYGPNVRVVLLFGADNVHNFTKLKADGSRRFSGAELEEIIMDFGLVVMQRKGFDPVKDLNSVSPPGVLYSEEAVIVDDDYAHLMDSTSVRKAVREGKSIKEGVLEPVEAYIKQTKLYLEPFEKMTCNDN